MSFIEAIAENWWQFAIAFAVLTYIARISNRDRIESGKPATSLLEDLKGVLAIIAVFVFLSGGKGCSGGGSSVDMECRPAGTAIYNDC